MESRAPHGLSWTESRECSGDQPEPGVWGNPSVPLGGMAEPRPLVSLSAASRGRQGMSPPVSSARTGGPGPGGLRGAWTPLFAGPREGSGLAAFGSPRAGVLAAEAVS